MIWHWWNVEALTSWWLPLTAAALLLARKRTVTNRRGQWQWGLLAPVLLLLPYAHLAAGVAGEWLSFTYGAEQVGRQIQWYRLWPALPLLAGVTGYEFVVRATLLPKAARRSGPLPAILLTSLIGAALAALRLRSGSYEPPAFVAVAATVFLSEVTLGFLFALCGTLIPCVLLHFGARFMEAFVVGDILSPYTPALNYTSSSATLYVGQIVAQLVPALALAGICHFRRSRLAF